MDKENDMATGDGRRISRRELTTGGLALVASALAAKLGLAADMAMPHDPHMKHDMAGYGIPSGPPQQIAMLAYPNMTALDLVGPHQILAALGNVNVHVVWKDTNPLTTDAGLVVRPTMALRDCPDDLTVLFVPGGSRGTVPLMDDPEVVDFLARKGRTARYVTSVCTGSLLLGAAGLLRGYRATSHWGFRDLLPLMGATLVAERVVEDRNRITGAGVTAGIDFGLRLAALLRNEKHAKSLQLTLEYDPQPPYRAGTPSGAGADITHMLLAAFEPTYEQGQAAARRAQQRLKTS